ncbi:holin [Schaalia sp. lx-100]|uniref:holin n=1 Tax=Schaalia sp. lx-100 TaxID=2899081 RepID=UPI001E2A40A2|nr:holin [Schaalia sp. lx-100]MCD4558216.1 holin [Schaalia sp. lx-100]
MKKTFWLGVFERAVKTAAQALLAVLTTGTVLWGLDWGQAVGLALTAALISVLTSIADPRAADVHEVTFSREGD